MGDHIRIERCARPDGRFARLTIDNAAKLNSLSSLVLDAFVESFSALSRDEDLRAVVLTGAGERAFIGGADIGEMAAIASPEPARAFIGKVHAACQAVRDCPVPVIARINGFCLGAGLEIAAACDLRLAADGAAFGMPEVRLGLPSVVEAALLPSLIGWGRTRRILYTGETFEAADALAWGLVEEVFPAAELDLAVDALLAELFQAEPRAVRLQKALVRRWEDLPASAAIAAGIDAFADAFTTDEPTRALGAFFARRRAAAAAR